MNTDAPSMVAVDERPEILRAVMAHVRPDSRPVNVRIELDKDGTALVSGCYFYLGVDREYCLNFWVRVKRHGAAWQVTRCRYQSE